MNQEQRKAIAYEIEAVALYYGRKLEKQILSMMVDDLEDLPTDHVLKAYKTYRRDSKNKFFPLPAQIREMIEPVETSESIGREIAGRIVTAISKFGYMRGKEAMLFLGPVGTRPVNRLGGWQYICENHGLNINPTSFFAQARDVATDIAKIPQLRNELPALEHETSEKLGMNLDESENQIPEESIDDVMHRFLNSIGKS